MEESPSQRFPSTAIAIGDCLDERYQIVEVLGQGGMGTVYKAMHLSLNKAVAVKALHPHIVLDKNANARFQQEIKAMSMLSHPHLISVLDVGTTKSGTPYFVMEYLDGPTLGDLIKKQGSPSDARAIRMFIQMADALAYAHDQGIIHRDLKPNNIVVLSNRDKDFVKLVDLGIAKLLTPSDGEQQGLTITGEIFGSPLYMSPEQCSGKSIDGRSDIYSLGCLMYETICGEPPIKGGSALETFMLHVNTEAPPISAGPGVQMTAALKLVEPVIARSMQKKPEDRFQTMAELAHELERIEKTSSSNLGAPASLPAPKPVSLNRPETGLLESSSQNLVRTPVPATSRSDSSGFTEGGVFNNPKSRLIATIASIIFACAAGFAIQNRLAPDKPPTVFPVVPTQMPTQLPNTFTLPPSQHFTVSYPKSESKTEVDVLSVYLGKNQEAGNLDLPGTVEVKVHASEKPITLVLVSYKPTNWRILRENQSVKIDRVLASSYFPPITVSGVPPGVPLETSWYQFFGEDGQKLAKARKNPFQFFTLGASLMPNAANIEGTADFKNMKKIVESHLDQPIHSFQGAYQDGYFEVR